MVDFTKLFVGGLAKEVTKQQLKQYFINFGAVSNILLKKIKTKEGTSINKGFGFVVFKNEASALSCLEQKVHVLNSQIIDVRRAVLSQKLVKEVSQKILVPSKVSLPIFSGKDFNRTVANNYKKTIRSSYEFSPF